MLTLSRDDDEDDESLQAAGRAGRAPAAGTSDRHASQRERLISDAHPPPPDVEERGYEPEVLAIAVPRAFFDAAAGGMGDTVAIPLPHE